MIRKCDGTDPNLLAEDGQPCHCGITFDDVEYTVIWPHERIPTREERERAYREMIPVLDDLLKDE